MMSSDLTNPEAKDSHGKRKSQVNTPSRIPDYCAGHANIQPSALRCPVSTPPLAGSRSTLDTPPTCCCWIQYGICALASG